MTNNIFFLAIFIKAIALWNKGFTVDEFLIGFNPKNSLENFIL